MCTVRRLSVRGLFLLVFLLGPAPLLSVEHAENRAFRTAINSITTTELGHHVDVLADDSFEGREAGTAGGRAAGRYLCEAMEDDGIEPAGEDGGYFQLFGNGYRNLLGMIRGRDPKLQHKYIVVGAHYDHVGYGTHENSFGPIGQIHNGADDNASGTAGVLEVMQAFSMLPEPPRCSILFAFWDGEEKGLLGSKHFVRYPTVPLEDVVMVLNCDMIGRLRERRLKVHGARTAGGLRRLVCKANTECEMCLDFVWDVQPSSDHSPFFRDDVPFLMFHTGLHDNYHRPSDDAERVNDKGVRRVSELLFRVTHELSESPQRISFREQARRESNHTRSQFEQAASPAPTRLGVSWSRDDAGPGLQLTQVIPGSPADQGGLRVGDRLLEFSGRKIQGGDQFRLVVLAAPPRTYAMVERPGETEPVKVPVNPRGTPVRLGISWKQDAADPSMVILTRVIPGSAADQAGLRVGDRIYAVDGQGFADGKAFGNLARRRPGPLRLKVERDGIIEHMTVRPLQPAKDAAAAWTGGDDRLTIRIRPTSPLPRAGLFCHREELRNQRVTASRDDCRRLNHSSI
ncbi:MAG: M28 family peptidase [Planctomycetota bacterium]